MLFPPEDQLPSCRNRTCLTLDACGAAFRAAGCWRLLRAAERWENEAILHQILSRRLATSDYFPTNRGVFWLVCVEFFCWGGRRSINLLSAVERSSHRGEIVEPVDSTTTAAHRAVGGSNQGTRYFDQLNPHRVEDRFSWV